MIELTHDGEIVAAALAVAALCVPLWIFAKARRNGGVAELPSALVSFLLFGFGGGALSPGLIIIASDTYNKAALIEHERCHQHQMLRDGYWTWLSRYVFDLRWRQQYEVEAYRVWVQHSPDDLMRCARDLVNGYDLLLTFDGAVKLLTGDTAKYFDRNLGI